MSSHQCLKQAGESGNIKDWELPTSVSKCDRLVSIRKRERLEWQEQKGLPVAS